MGLRYFYNYLYIYFLSFYVIMVHRHKINDEPNLFGIFFSLYSIYCVIIIDTLLSLIDTSCLRNEISIENLYLISQNESECNEVTGWWYWKRVMLNQQTLNRLFEKKGSFGGRYSVSLWKRFTTVTGFTERGIATSSEFSLSILTDTTAGARLNVFIL